MRIENKIIKIIEDNIEFSYDVKRSSRLVNDLGIDSLSTLYIVSAIEKEFNIKICDHEINSNNFGTIEDLINFINNGL